MSSIWLAVDKSGEELMFSEQPFRDELDCWSAEGLNNMGWAGLQEGFIEFALGRRLTWADEPVELREVKRLANSNYSQYHTGKHVIS
jgi:hypothetical protein